MTPEGRRTGVGEGEIGGYNRGSGDTGGLVEFGGGGESGGGEELFDGVFFEGFLGEEGFGEGVEGFFVPF